MPDRAHFRQISYLLYRMVILLINFYILCLLQTIYVTTVWSFRLLIKFYKLLQRRQE